MKITIRTPEVNFSMPVPLGMAGFAIRAIPEIVFDKWRRESESPYAYLISKDTCLMYWEVCKEELKICKGLEVIHVEAHDGTFVSVIM